MCCCYHVEINIKDHKPPKRPHGSSILFMLDRKETLQEKIDGPESAVAFLTESARLWRELPEEEKEVSTRPLPSSETSLTPSHPWKYRVRARGLSAEYAVRRDEYLKTVPRDVLREINARRRKRGASKIKGPSGDMPLRAYMR